MKSKEAQEPLESSQSKVPRQARRGVEVDRGSEEGLGLTDAEGAEGDEEGIDVSSEGEANWSNSSSSQTDASSQEDKAKVRGISMYPLSSPLCLDLHADLPSVTSSSSTSSPKHMILSDPEGGDGGPLRRPGRQGRGRRIERERSESVEGGSWEEGSQGSPGRPRGLPMSASRSPVRTRRSRIRRLEGGTKVIRSTSTAASKYAVASDEEEADNLDEAFAQAATRIQLPRFRSIYEQVAFLTLSDSPSREVTMSPSSLPSGGVQPASFSFSSASTSTTTTTTTNSTTSNTSPPPGYDGRIGGAGRASSYARGGEGGRGRPGSPGSMSDDPIQPRLVDRTGSADRPGSVDRGDSSVGSSRWSEPQDEEDEYEDLVSGEEEEEFVRRIHDFQVGYVRGWERRGLIMCHHAEGLT